MSDVSNPWLYHFTHINNLPGIIAKGLVADSGEPALSVECGERGIKNRRRETRVPIDPGGVVADYAPFYFAARSPMLYRIHCGGVAGYQRGQGELVYLMTRLSHVESRQLRWIATDRNAVVAPCDFVDTATRLEVHIDWGLMKAERWADTPDDGSRKQRRMAEFLVHQHVPWSVFSHVAVQTEEMAERVREVVGKQHQAPKVVVRPKWYF